MPASEPSSSAPTMTMSAKPMPSFSPVKMAGKAPGQATVVKIPRLPAP